MRRFRNLCPARAALVVLACALAGTQARAEPPPAPPGADALASGHAAWQKRQFSAAELFYKSALDHGGLAPAETLDAYVHLGAARAVLGKKDLARAAFRQAALIDAHFRAPREAGRKANAIAILARRDEAKLGSIVLGATIPQSVPAGEAFGVDATLDPKHAAVTAKVGIDARDPLSGKHFTATDVASTKTHFEVPAGVTLPGATLIVRVDALDPHDNRLSSRELRVHVEMAPAPPPVSELPSKPFVSPAGPLPAAPAVLTFTTDSGASHKEQTSNHGFWSSPWPYFIGGVVLAAGGAFAYYELRPTDDVSLGGARVTTR